MLKKNGFDLNEFVIDNEYSAHNLLVSMQEYAEQYHAAKVEAVTDKEIDREVRKLPYVRHLDDGQFNDGQMSGFEQGAKWMRDRMKGGNL